MILEPDRELVDVLGSCRRLSAGVNSIRSIRQNRYLWVGFAQRYFPARASVRLYASVKIWLAGKRFWVGWGKRTSNGTGCRPTSNMAWPPNAWSITTLVNLVYQIPMATVYGPGIPIPAKAPATWDISLEEIRQEIIGVIMKHDIHMCGSMLALFVYSFVRSPASSLFRVICTIIVVRHPIITPKD